MSDSNNKSNSILKNKKPQQENFSFNPNLDWINKQRDTKNYIRVRNSIEAAGRIQEIYKNTKYENKNARKDCKLKELNKQADQLFEKYKEEKSKMYNKKEIINQANSKMSNDSKIFNLPSYCSDLNQPDNPYAKLLNIREEKINNLVEKNQEIELKLVTMKNERDSLIRALDNIIQKYNPPRNENLLKQNHKY